MFLYLLVYDPLCILRGKLMERSILIHGKRTQVISPINISRNLGDWPS